MEEGSSIFGSTAACIEYIKQWKDLFHGDHLLDKLKLKAVKGELHDSYFRSICWRVFLKCFSENPLEWADATNCMRQKYEHILDELQVNPRLSMKDVDLYVNHPLTQSDESPWYWYFQDIELKVAIQQDVVRTFPEVKFFQNSKVQKMMINILFCYAREFPVVSYRQGMHELLAPVIYVLHMDQEAYLKMAKIQDLPLEICILLNQNYTEHDAYFLFCNLMEAVEGWYIVTENYSESKNSIVNEPFLRHLDDCQGNGLGILLTKINENCLRNHDFELYSHLNEMDIGPQIYGIRWLRLLFGREFQIQDLLMLWDAIFATSSSFDLVEYIFTAMLIHIKDLLIQGNYTSCLSVLMRYPDIENIRYIVDLALHLKEPEKYCKPTGINLKSSNSQSSLSKTHAHNEGKPGTEPVHPISRPGLLALTNSSNALQGGYLDEACEVLETDNPTSVSFDEKLGAYSNSGSEEQENRSQTLPRSFIFDGDKENKNMAVRNKKIWDCFKRKNPDTKTKNVIFKEMFPIQRSSLEQPFPGNALNLEGDVRNRHIDAQLYELRSMNKYCCDQMVTYVNQIKEYLNDQPIKNRPEIFASLAGLEEVHDILRKCVNFSTVVLNYDNPCDSDKNFSEDHVGNEMNEDTIPNGPPFVRTNSELKPNDLEAKQNSNKESEILVENFTEGN